MDLYVGTSGYSYKEWKGAFYPKDLPASRMLKYYGEQFRAVEINNTFHAMPKESVLENWAAEVPAEFVFALKAPQRITHIGRLKGVADSVAYLFGVADALKGRLGPVLFQLPPSLKKDAARLRDFLELIPEGRRAAFEFRHKSWFDDEVFGLLRDRGAQVCFAEAEDVIEMPFVSTADWGYLRLRRQDYDGPAMQRRLEEMREQNWREAFVFFKHEDEAKGPKMARRFLELAG